MNLAADLGVGDRGLMNLAADLGAGDCGLMNLSAGLDRGVRHRGLKDAADLPYLRLIDRRAFGFTVDLRVSNLTGRDAGLRPDHRRPLERELGRQRDLGTLEDG